MIEVLFQDSGSFRFRDIAFQSLEIVVGHRLLDHIKSPQIVKRPVLELIFEVILLDLRTKTGIFFMFKDLQCKEAELRVKSQHYTDEGLESGELSIEKIRDPLTFFCYDDGLVGKEYILIFGKFTDDLVAFFFLGDSGLFNLNLFFIEDLPFHVEGYKDKTLLRRQEITNGLASCIRYYIAVDGLQSHTLRDRFLIRIPEQSKPDLLLVHMFIVFFSLVCGEKGRSHNRGGKDARQGQTDDNG